MVSKYWRRKWTFKCPYCFSLRTIAQHHVNAQKFVKYVATQTLTVVCPKANGFILVG